MSSVEAFATAIERKNLQLVKSMLANREVDANVRLPRERHPPALVHAAWCRPRHVETQKEVVEHLLNAGARIDDVDDLQRTACHYAAESDNDSVLELLIARGANLTLKDGDQKTALDRASFQHRTNGALMLIAAGAPVDVDAHSDNLCRLAARSTDAIQTLISRGISIRDLRDYYKYTPLHVVAEYNSFSGLADARAVVNMLVNVCHVDLEDQAPDETCVRLATWWGNFDTLRCFVEAGANVDAVHKHGRTALHVVRDFQCAMVLLAAGADVHMLNSRGDTPLHNVVATQRGDNVLPIVHVLLAGGADLDAADRDGRTVRQFLADAGWRIDPAEVESARCEIASLRLDFVRCVRHRAMQVCIGLQSLRLDALQMCEILGHACGPLAPLIAFHQWWAIATTVKHFKRN